MAVTFFCSLAKKMFPPNGKSNGKRSLSYVTGPCHKSFEQLKESQAVAIDISVVSYIAYHSYPEWTTILRWFLKSNQIKVIWLINDSYPSRIAFSWSQVTRWRAMSPLKILTSLMFGWTNHFRLIPQQLHMLTVI